MTDFRSLLCATGMAVTVSLPAWSQNADTVMATVNGVDITLGHMIALQERLPEQYRQLDDATLFSGVLDQLIQQTALSQEIEKDQSKTAKLKLENEMRAFQAGELLAKVGTTKISDEEIESYYKKHYEGADPEKEFNASHILVESEDEAKEIKKMLSEGADFAELAKEKSTGPSGPRGGELGWFGKGAMVPEFENAVLSLADGDVSDPVQTQFGWHVVKRNESRNKEVPTLDAVRNEIEQQLRSNAIEKAIDDITSSADVSRAEVEVDPSVIRKVELLSE